VIESLDIRDNSSVVFDRQELIARVGAAIQAYQRSTDAFDEAVATQLDVNRTDLRCLDVLSEGPRRAGDVARGTGLSSSATTTLLDRLEARDLVHRVRDPSDRRQVLIELTERGQRLVAQYYGPVAVEGAEMLGRYTDSELALLIDVLGRATELTDRHRARVGGAKAIEPGQPAI
jgi:DNA-binding MarR family transcriptional regulator